MDSYSKNEKIVISVLFAVGLWLIASSGVFSSRASFTEVSHELSDEAFPMTKSESSINKVSVKNNRFHSKPEPLSDSGKNKLDILWETYMGGNKEVISDYLTQGGEPNIFLPDGTTLIALLATLGDVDNLRLAIDMGADMELADENGQTPLMSGALGGDIASIRLLLERGANPLAIDNDGSSAYAHAVHSLNLDAVELFSEKMSGISGAEEVKAEALEYSLNNGLTEATKIILHFNPELIRSEKIDLAQWLYKSCGPWKKPNSSIGSLLDSGFNYETFDEHRMELAQYYTDKGREDCAAQILNM